MDFRTKCSLASGPGAHSFLGERAPKRSSGYPLLEQSLPPRIVSPPPPSSHAVS